MASRRLRVLSCDGGGVRGLSSLIILRTLLCLISKALYGTDEQPMRPQDVFDIFVGTSTGGLIAIMIVKLNMDVDQCIMAYKDLAKRIFSKRSLLGKLSLGFAKPKYFADRLQNVIVNLSREYTNLDSEYLMENTELHPRLLCTVICRELENNWTRRRKEKPVFLCSHKCRPAPGKTNPYETCRMCDAARATASAPTYFPPVKVLRKILVDGGFGDTNNPSIAAWDHYTESRIRQEIEDSDHTQWVNLGTGTRPTNLGAPPPTWGSFLLPEFAAQVKNTVRNLEAIATQSETVGEAMKRLAKVSQKRLEFDRFSADTGLHDIGLNEFEKLETIEEKTKEYLMKPKVSKVLVRVAKSLAADFRIRREERRLIQAKEIPQLRPPTSGHSHDRANKEDDDRALASPYQNVPGMSGASEPTVKTSERSATPPSEQNETRIVVTPMGQENDFYGTGHQFSPASAKPKY